MQEKIIWYFSFIKMAKKMTFSVLFVEGGISPFIIIIINPYFFKLYPLRFSHLFFKKSIFPLEFYTNNRVFLDHHGVTYVGLV